MWKCFLCGGEVFWSNDFMYDEFGIDEANGIVHTFQCSECGATYEVFEDIEDEELLSEK